MKRPVFIVCLKYVPGMWHHMASFAGQLLGRGYPCRFLIDAGFDWMLETRFADCISCTGTSGQLPSLLKKVCSFLWLPKSKYRHIFKQYSPALVLLVSWHPLNFLLARMVKALYPDVPVIAWLHEPYKDEKKIYGTKALIIYLVELFQTLSLPYVDVAIMHSQRALRLFKRRYPKFKGQSKIIPLHFQDDGLDRNVERRYISFLGRADRAKGIETFFALVEGMAQEDRNVHFQIVTSSPIQTYLEKLSPAARSRLKVVSKPRLADGEMRSGAANSLAVLALYQETMQSGVIPLALMKGTPVIGTDIEGLTEWIRSGETGVIVSRQPSLKELMAAIRSRREQLNEMGPRCRQYYLETFDDRNWDRDYGWLRAYLADNPDSLQREKP